MKPAKIVAWLNNHPAHAIVIVAFVVVAAIALPISIGAVILLGGA